MEHPRFAAQLVILHDLGEVTGTRGLAVCLWECEVYLPVAIDVLLQRRPLGRSAGLLGRLTDLGITAVDKLLLGKQHPKVAKARRSLFNPSALVPNITYPWIRTILS